MAERKPAKKAAKKAVKKVVKKAVKKTQATRTKAFSAEESAAMKDRAAEVKRRRSGTVDGEKDLREKIAAMPDADRELATRLHELVMDVAPQLEPRTWYGMPAYSKDGDVLLFLQNASKFKMRYATLGFSDKAKLDKGSLWPTYFAVAAMNATTEKEIRALVKKAVG